MLVPGLPIFKCSFMRSELYWYLLTVSGYSAYSKHIKYISWLLTVVRSFIWTTTLISVQPLGSHLYSWGLSDFCHCWKACWESGPQVAFATGIWQVMITNHMFSILCQVYNGSLTHLFTVDLVVATQIAGGGSADLSSSIWKQCTKILLCGMLTLLSCQDQLYIIKQCVHSTFVCWLYHGTC